jgi:hypothetical protein
MFLLLQGIVDIATRQASCGRRGWTRLCGAEAVWYGTIWVLFGMVAATFCVACIAGARAVSARSRDRLVKLGFVLGVLGAADLLAFAVWSMVIKNVITIVS